MLDYHEIELNFEAQNKVDLNNLKKPIRRVSLLSSDHNGLSLNIKNVAHNKNIADDDSVEHMENSDTHNDENLLVISDPLKDYSTIRRTNRQIPQRRRSSIVKEILHHHPFDAQDTNNEKELLKLEKVMKEQRDLDAGASLAMAMSGNIAVAKYNSFSLNIDATKKSDSIDLQEVENDDFVKKLSIEDYHK